MDFFTLPKRLQWASWIALLFVAWLVWDLSHWWTLRDDYSFGFLAPVFSLYVVYDRWPRIRQLLSGQDGEGRDDGWLTRTLSACAIVVLLGGMLWFIFGALLKAATGPNLPSSILMTFTFGGMVLAGAYYFADTDLHGRPLLWRPRLRLASLLLFPALIWIISAPMFSFLENALSTFLLNKVIYVVFGIFSFLGFPLEQQGSVLILPNGQVGVEDACSGIRSLTACLFAGSFLAAVFLNKFWKKCLMVGCALVLAVIMNLFRSLFLTSWAYRYGSDSIEGTVHDATGYAVLGLTVVCLLCLMPVFNFRWEYEAEEGDSEAAAARKDEEPEPASQDSR